MAVLTKARWKFGRYQYGRRSWMMRVLGGGLTFGAAWFIAVFGSTLYVLGPLFVADAVYDVSVTAWVLCVLSWLIMGWIAATPVVIVDGRLRYGLLLFRKEVDLSAVRDVVVTHLGYKYPGVVILVGQPEGGEAKKVRVLGTDLILPRKGRLWVSWVRTEAQRAGARLLPVSDG